MAGWIRVIGRSGLLWLVLVAGVGAGCAPRTPPTTPGTVTWRQPTLPRDLAAQTADAAKYQQAWSQVRNGDLRGGEKSFEALLRVSPAFYPAAASLGELKLQSRQFRDAATLFGQALAANPSYVPGLIGMVDARLGAGDDAGSLVALKALLKVDPARADARSRLDVVALRLSQTELALAERFRGAGQLDEAERHFTLALEATPENGPVLRGLAAVELARGDLGQASARVQQAIALDPQDAAAHALFGDVLEAQGQPADAAAAYGRAVAIDPRPAWKDRRAALLERSATAALPENYRAIADAATVSRGQVAAVLGVRLAPQLQRAPARVTEVVTDVRNHWAAQWILPVVRAGWIDALPNHTFQPAGAVHRADLARIVAAVLTATASARGKQVDAGSKTFADVPKEHAAYRVISTAVTAGIMSVDASNRFQPAGVVSGAELFATMARLEAAIK